MAQPTDILNPSIPKRSARQLQRGSFLSALMHWRGRLVSRRALGRLDPHLLRDVGLDHFTARNEADKPFWRD